MARVKSKPMLHVHEKTFDFNIEELSMDDVHASAELKNVCGIRVNRSDRDKIIF